MILDIARKRVFHVLVLPPPIRVGSRRSRRCKVVLSPDGSHAGWQDSFRSRLHAGADQTDVVLALLVALIQAEAEAPILFLQVVNNLVQESHELEMHAVLLQQVPEEQFADAFLDQ